MPDDTSRGLESIPPVRSAECDVLIIGGGPAGATAAAILAERGRDVVLIEKDRHPRFHIGESLLPGNLPLFERLGIAEEVRGIGVYKPGAEFVSDEFAKTNLLMFASANHLAATHAYQVRRAEFDKLLLDNCRRRGAHVVENTRVTEVEFDPQARVAVRAVNPQSGDTVWHPKFLIDASGRDTFIANRLHMKTADKRNNTAAIFGHFDGVPRRAGEAAGVITVHLVDDGWFWMIPLQDGLMSVGLVGSPALFKNRRESTEELFWASVKASPSVAERMRDARATGPLVATGNYSYKAARVSGDRYLLIGDAFTFLDPVFSSGVMFAMSSGLLGAEAVDAYLTDQRRGRRALGALERRVRRAVSSLAWLICRINDPVMRHMLLHPNNMFRMRDGLIGLLGGNFFDTGVPRLPVVIFKLAYYLQTYVPGFSPIESRDNPPGMQDHPAR
jgi:flavin-dependent dehydrogenase